MHNKSSRPSVDCSKEYSKISSRDLGCYDPKISTFATFKTLDFDNKNKDKNRRTRSRPNWNFSATTLTRDDSPSHVIPKQQRFTTADQDIKRSGNFLSLELRAQLTKGISFTKSKRKDYFVKKEISNYPSSATYHHNPQSPSRNEPKLNVVGFDSDVEERIHYINHTINVMRGKKRSEGFTIGKFEKTHARFLHHGRQIPHTPEIYRNNPGVGAYQIDESHSKPKTASYSMRLVLQRFNEKDNLIPGSGAYKAADPKPHSVSSINQRGTFQQSKRTFLANPDNETPGPGKYERT